MDIFFQSISEHLSFFGYRINDTPAPEVPAEILRAAHDTKPYLWVIPINNGALLRATFTVGPEAKRDPNVFLSFLNESNGISLVAHYWLTTDVMAIGAWYAPPYNRQSFTSFFEQFLTDIKLPATTYPEMARRFFPS